MSYKGTSEASLAPDASQGLSVPHGGGRLSVSCSR